MGLKPGIQSIPIQLLIILSRISPTKIIPPINHQGTANLRENYSGNASDLKDIRGK